MQPQRSPWHLPLFVLMLAVALACVPAQALADDYAETPSTEQAVAEEESSLPAEIPAAATNPAPDADGAAALADASDADGAVEETAISDETAVEADDVVTGDAEADDAAAEENLESTEPADAAADDPEPAYEADVNPDPDAESAQAETLAAAPMMLKAAPKAAYKAEKAGWNLVNNTYYWYEKKGDTTPRKGWLVTAQYPLGYSGGLQRYWLDAKTGALAMSKLVNTGTSGWTYARAEGYVVRGKFTNGDNGYVYLANNDGKLESTGWLVTNKYDGGLQRYWIDTKTHAAIPGYSTAGWAHYTRPEGYVARGKYVHPETGYVYLANNDGKLELGGTGKGGWLVTKAYDGGYQRYWIDAKAHAAIPGYSKSGWTHYTMPGKGYVARGSFTDSYGRKGSADNDGKLKGAIPVWNGWVVTNVFGQGLQRYWFENDQMVKDKLLTQKVAGWWAFARPEGYVVRGKYTHPKTGYVYLANNDGKLENPGWLVTNKYDGGMQRYWIDSKAHAAVPGYSTAGWAHVTLPDKGYVARNQYQYVEDGWYIADNDGKLTRKSPPVAQVIEQYVKWAVDIANDDTHGYSQVNRWGPDYDCSSLIITALKAVGLKVGNAVYTGNMKSELTKYGWEWIEDISQRRRGDILLNITDHTEIYLGNGKNVGAHIDENGGITGKTPGDQTKHEIDVGPYHNANWDGLLRLKRIV